ncbi:ABC transporter substrate-binding protein [Bradyrhizobium sp. 197]|uniref:ABC transporter substrate-binding protein n=1 Tax=Bradyrhizobium sp. 197 TaxID=2782663 RepID=UPI001FF91E2A|nr:ABC transporter substrate-binding protein [Bradyrhizobium sp. 197]MCK1479494.1 ABC transporter substrate-binding protein [Bradyrhizobium sp. 197]
MATRREWLLASGAFAAALTIGSRTGFAQGAKTLKVGFGQKAISPNLINLLIGETLGYNAAEGFKVQGMALGGNNNVQVATDKGDVDVGVGVPSTALPILSKGEWGSALNFYEYTYPYKWDIAIKKGAGTKSYAELKGKNIGVSDFAGTEYPVTRNVLRSLGLDPDRDVKWTAVGNGIPAGVALDRGAIDALAYYDTGFGQIEAAGIAIEMLPRPEKLPMIGGQFLMAHRARIEADRALFVGYGRSVAKASVFLLANPSAGAQAFLKMYPETAPRGSTAEQAVKSVIEAISRRIKLYEPPYQGAKMGSIREEEFATEAQMNGWDIKDFKKIYTNDLIDEINKFDVEQIRAQARS